MGELILDLGIADQIGRALVANAEIPRRASQRTPSRRETFLKVTPALRARVAARATNSILKLATTYTIGLSFRNHLFLTTPRGTVLNQRYEEHLPEIYEIARSDYTLLNDLGNAWLGVYKFVDAMVQVAADKSTPKARGRRLSEQSYEQGRDLLARFGEAARSERLKALTRELAGELDEYRGLTAEESVSKLRSSGPKRK
jgi:hypothetical protein